MERITEHRKNKTFESYYFISLLLIIMYMIVQPIWHNPSITGLVWKTGIIMLFISSLFANHFAINKYDLFGISLLAFIMLLNFAISNEPITSNLIFSCLALICMLLEINFFSYVKISKKLFDQIYWSAVILTLLFYSYTFTSIANTFYYKETFIENIYFVFNLDNPNVAGIYLYYIFCILLINFPKRKYKFINIILLIICFYMIYNTNCRSALFSAIGVLALSLMSFTKKMPPFFIFMAWAFPIIFVSAYMSLFESGYENIMIFGKSLFSGRQNTFKEYLLYIYKPVHYFIGNLNEVQLQNSHNAPLAFYTSLGLIGAAITELMLLFKVLKINKPSKNSFFAVSSIMGLFICSSAEASMFLGGFPGVVFLTTLFLLANYE